MYKFTSSLRSTSSTVRTVRTAPTRPVQHSRIACRFCSTQLPTASHPLPLSLKLSAVRIKLPALNRKTSSIFRTDARCKWSITIHVRRTLTSIPLSSISTCSTVQAITPALQLTVTPTTQYSEPCELKAILLTGYSAGAQQSAACRKFLINWYANRRPTVRERQRFNSHVLTLHTIRYFKLKGRTQKAAQHTVKQVMTSRLHRNAKPHFGALI